MLGDRLFSSDDKVAGFVCLFCCFVIWVFCYISYQILLGWETYLNIIVKPTNSPTQGQ